MTIKQIARRVGAILAATLLVVMMLVTPVFGLANPDLPMAWGTGTTSTYRAFYNVSGTGSGDWLFVAEGFVKYTVTPNTTASQAFIFEVVNTSGNVTLFATPLVAYGDRPIGIYVSQSQATSANLTVGTAYILKIIGNPLIFSSSTGNNVTATLTAGDFKDQSVGKGNLDTDQIRTFIMNQYNGMVYNLQNYDVLTYTSNVLGYNYLNTTGGSIFAAGIPNLQALCPILFQASNAPLTGNKPASGVATYANALTPANQMGTTIANGLTNLGLYLGIDQALAGSTVLLLMGMAFCVFIFRKTESGIAVLTIASIIPFAGSYLGLMPLALAFTFTLFVVIIMLYYFFSRGIL